MTEIKEQLIEQAKAQYKDIYPVGQQTELTDCFTIHDNVLYFWFNDNQCNTKILKQNLN